MYGGASQIVSCGFARNVSGSCLVWVPQSQSIAYLRVQRKDDGVHRVEEELHLAELHGTALVGEHFERCL